MKAISTMLVDGEASDTVPANDRGLQYGDGVFETIGVVAGRPALWQRHMARLARSCVRLGLPRPEPVRLRAEVDWLLRDVDQAVVKLVVTRGSGGRGYRAPDRVQPRRIVSLHAYPPYPLSWWRDGVRVRVCRTRLGDQPLLAGLKHLNRLEQVLARNEWSDPGVAEGLMLSQNGGVIEGTMSNVFVATPEGLFTPSVERAGVAGVMREHLMEIASRLGLSVAECDLDLEALRSADEAFLANSIIGVWPIVELEGTRYRVQEVARRFLRELENDTALPSERR